MGRLHTVSSGSELSLMVWWRWQWTVGGGTSWEGMVVVMAMTTDKQGGGYWLVLTILHNFFFNDACVHDHIFMYEKLWQLY